MTLLFYSTKAIKYSLTEGLPKFYAQREQQLDALWADVNENRCVLVASPPQTGKSSMATLFRRYIKKKMATVDPKERRRVFYLSFSGYNVSGQSLNEYFQNKTKANTFSGKGKQL